MSIQGPRDQKFTSGAAHVSIQNPAEIITDQNQYWCWYQAVGTATNFSHVQLLNPSGSGITAIVTGLWVVPEAAGDVWVKEYSTALTASGATPQNTYVGGAAASCTVNKAINQTVYGTGKFYLYANALGAGMTNYLSEGGIVLPANTGIVLRNSVADSDLIVGFYWTEVAD